MTQTSSNATSESLTEFFSLSLTFKDKRQMLTANITIESGRIFVNGRETVDPTFIGYTLLDIAEASGSGALHCIKSK